MEKWKAGERFPLSHNPGCCYGLESVDVVYLRGLKPQSFWWPHSAVGVKTPTYQPCPFKTRAGSVNNVLKLYS
jgi:hypothetical protein